MTDAKQSLIQIEQLMQDYFDGLYLGDVTLLSDIFHPDARYITATSGSLVQFSMEEYFELVRLRPTPASQQQTRRDQIDGIELIGNNTALVKARCAIFPKYFNDRLSLIKLNGKWQIISKIFHYDIDDTEED